MKEANGVPLPRRTPPPRPQPASLPLGLTDDMANHGVLPGDPLFSVVKELADAVRVVADGSQALNASVQAAAAEEVGKAVDRIGEVEALALDRLASSLERMAVSGDRRLSWKLSGIIAAGGLVVLLVGGGIGWYAGRSASVAVTGELGAAFQDGPEAGRLWLKLWRENDPVKALSKCEGVGGFEQGGRRGCWVPLWLEAAPAPK